MSLNDFSSYDLEEVNQTKSKLTENGDGLFIADLTWEDCLQSSLDLEKGSIEKKTNSEINKTFGETFKRNFFRGMNSF